MATVVQVPGVYPSGSTLSITGGVVAGDGHVAGGIARNQLGVPTIKLSFKSVTGGVASAAAFGVPTVTVSVAPGTQIVSVRGVIPGFALTILKQAVLNKRVLHGAPISLFGVPKLNVRLPVSGGVSSASAFGTPTIKTRVTVQVPGLIPYPNAVPSITGAVITGDGHVVGGYGGPGWMFGHPSIYTLVRVAVGGVPSAALLGAVQIVQIVHPASVPSAQQFGTKIGIKFRVPGVPSAQAFGKPEVYLVWMRVFPCTDVDLDESLDLDLDLDEAPVTDLDLQPLVCT